MKGVGPLSPKGGRLGPTVKTNKTLCFRNTHYNESDLWSKPMICMLPRHESDKISFTDCAISWTSGQNQQVTNRAIPWTGGQNQQVIVSTPFSQT